MSLVGNEMDFRSDDISDSYYPFAKNQNLTPNTPSLASNDLGRFKKQVVRSNLTHRFKQVPKLSSPSNHRPPRQQIIDKLLLNLKRLQALPYAIAITKSYQKYAKPLNRYTLIYVFIESG